MNTEDKFHLDNPPIKGVSLAIFINSDSYNTDFINSIKPEFQKDYPNEAPFKALSIGFNKDNNFEISDQSSSGFILENSDKTGLWNLDLQKILYSDKSKYINFENYLNKFFNHFNILKDKLDNKFNYSGIALKYSNEFDFPITSLQEHFAILPLFQQEYENNLYAANTSCIVINNVLNNENPQMTAGVIAAFSVFEQIPTKFKIKFDIDVRYNLQEEISYDEDIFKDQIKQIRLFKNKIFFANVKNAKGDFSE